MTTETVTPAQRVENSAKWLDAHVGDLIPADWRSKIDSDTLESAYADHCALTQIIPASPAPGLDAGGEMTTVDLPGYCTAFDRWHTGGLFPGEPSLWDGTPTEELAFAGDFMTDMAWRDYIEAVRRDAADS